MLMIYIFSSGSGSSYLNLALSFGARRRDLFWAMQGMFLVYALACLLLRAGMLSLVSALDWDFKEARLLMLSQGGLNGGLYLLIAVTLCALGALCGLAMARSRVLGVLCVLVVCALCTAALVLLMLDSRGEVTLYSVDGMTPDIVVRGFSVTWLAVTAGVVAVLAASELVLWRYIRRYRVR
jgi:hypothetical protein